MSLLKDKIFSSLAWSHFIVDVMNSQRAILLAYFSGPFGLSNTTLGGINTLYAFSGSLAQPVFGYLADRYGPRWVITGGILWMAGFFTLAVTIPGPVALIFLVLASLGSGAFHPAGSLICHIARSNAYGRTADDSGILVLLLRSVRLLPGADPGWAGDRFGRTIWIGRGCTGGSDPGSDVFECYQAGFNRSKEIHRSGRSGDPFTVEFTTSGCHRPGFCGSLTGLDAAGDDGFPAEISARPGLRATSYGFYAALFMGASAIGNVAGGRLADRIGKRTIIITSMLLTALPIFFIGMVGVNAGLIALIVVGRDPVGIDLQCHCGQSPEHRSGWHGTGHRTDPGIHVLCGIVGSLVEWLPG